MAGVLVNNGKARMLGLLSNKTGFNLEGLVLKLFQNDVTPTELYTSTGLTACAFGGYSPITLTGANWTITESTSGVASMSFAEQTFTCNASTSQSVYGYWIVTASSALVAAERFADAPYIVTNNGDAINVTPNIALD